MKSFVGSVSIGASSLAGGTLSLSLLLLRLRLRLFSLSLTGLLLLDRSDMVTISYILCGIVNNLLSLQCRCCDCSPERNRTKGETANRSNSHHPFSAGKNSIKFESFPQISQFRFRNNVWSNISYKYEESKNEVFQIE